jgi:hypothetical protein
MFSKLTRQLKREILANKGKAGFLGLAILVAVYYWIPAMAGLFAAADQQSTASVDPAPLAGATTLAGPDTTTTESPATVNNWQELMTSIENEPLMQSAVLPRRNGDPFTPLDAADPAEDEDTGEDAEGAVAQAGNITPDLLGMTLSSTLVGPRVTVVKISGKTYSFQSDSSWHGNTPARKLVYRHDRGDFEFDIVSARSGQLILARDGQQFALNVRMPTLQDDEGIHFLTESN